MKKMSLFQIVITSVFGALAVGGVMVFALFVGGTQNASVGPVTIWGTLDSRTVEAVLQNLAETDESLKTVTYVQKDSERFSEILTEALASGAGPDAYIIRQDFVHLDRGKLIPFPADYVSPTGFRNAFIDAAETFVFPEGVLAIPLIADPMVLYWNRDLLASNGFAGPPRYWDEMFDMARVITGCQIGGSTTEQIVVGCERETLSIRKATIALGAFRNVMWAKDILATIMTQAGGSVTRRDENNELVSGFVNRTGQSGNPNESALRFFTEFSDSSKEDYSWNNSLPNSRAAFTAGNLALYIGYASEADLLRNANPNLSMGIAPLPQVREAKRALTMARVYGIALTRTGKNTQGAAVTALALAQAYPSSIFAQAFGVVSARRDVLSRGGEGHYSLFASSTIASFSWVDPHPRKTDSLFGDMIDSVVSGSARISEAITRADQEMKSALDL